MNALAKATPPSDVTLADVIDHHVTEARAYAARCANWTRVAEKLKALDGQANAVRFDRLIDCAQLAAEIATRHAEMAEALSALRPAL